MRQTADPRLTNAPPYQVIHPSSKSKRCAHADASASPVRGTSAAASATMSGVVEELLAAIAGLSGVLGALVVVVADRLHRRDERQRQGRSDLEAALVGYLYALDSVAGEMAALPAPTRSSWVERRLKALVDEKSLHMASLGLQRLLIGRRWVHLGDEYTAAKARLLLVANEQILEIAREIDQHPTAGQLGTTDEWRSEYRALRQRLEVAVRGLLADAGRRTSRGLRRRTN